MSTKHTIFLFDSFGKFLGERELEKSAPHPDRYTLMAPTIVQGATPVWNFTKWVNVPNAHFVPTLAQLKLEAISKLQADFDIRLQAVKSDVAKYEPETWAIQNAEWVAYLANIKTPTPYVDALAAGRGIQKDVLMEKIGKKVVAIAYYQGIQHGIEDKIKAATTKEELSAITW